VKLLMIAVLTVLGLFVVSIGVCSALGLTIGTMGAIGKAHGGEDYGSVFFLFSIPGILLAALGVWLLRRLWRGLRNTAA